MKKHLNPKLTEHIKTFVKLVQHKLGAVSKAYWELSPEKRYRIRLALFAFGILVLGFIAGRLTTVHRIIKTDQQEKEIVVDRSGIISLSMPGINLNPEIYRFEKATLQKVPEEIKVPGRLVFNAEKGKLLSARVSGRVERIFSFEGASIDVGSPVIELYSPEFNSAQQEFLLTHQTVKILSQNSSLTNLLADAKITQDAAANRLRNLGFADSDILSLERSGKTSPNLLMRSPLKGVVVKRNVEPGAIVGSGEPLVFLADPKALWFTGNVFEQDARLIERGQRMRIHLEAYPDREIIVQVNYVSPTVDAQSRGIMIRADINNTDGSLRPDMFANAKLQIGTTQAIVVPQTAIVRDKEAIYAFVRTGPENYRRIIVKGFDFDGKRYAITDGIEPNTEILVKGAVLLNERFTKQE
ncbi:MAG: efflux RND transporter periplasmic adaptor subunit [Burkholderiaceae bacterium]|nr:efflux RND transporter periplasmic adaptor subunit [Burkholderiaceae bacterium]